MTAKKKITDKNGVQVFPITHTKAVFDDNGNSVEQRLQENLDLINQKQLEVGAVPSDITPTAGSTNWVTSGGVYNALAQKAGTTGNYQGINAGDLVNDEPNIDTFIQKTYDFTGVISINAIKGRLVRWNQIGMIRNFTINKSNSSNEDKATSTGQKFILNTGSNLTAHHKIYLAFDYTLNEGNDSKNSYIYIYQAVNNLKPLTAAQLLQDTGTYRREVVFDVIIAASASQTQNLGFYINHKAGATVNVTLSNFMAIDLTYIFGAGNEPTASVFKSWVKNNIGYSDWYAQNTGALIPVAMSGFNNDGSLVSVPVTEITSNGVAVFPNGMSQVGDAQDEIIEDKAYRRTSRRQYASGDEDDATVLTDGTNTWYALTEEEVLPLDSFSLPLSLEVGTGGYLNVQGVSGTEPTTTSPTIVTTEPLDAVNKIKGLSKDYVTVKDTQLFTEEEKTVARDNIGAASQGDVADVEKEIVELNDKTNKQILYSLFEKGGITINNSGWTYQDHTTRIRTKEGVTIRMHEGDSILTTKNVTGNTFYVGVRNPETGKYSTSGGWVSSWTASIDCEIVICVQNLGNPVEWWTDRLVIGRAGGLSVIDRLQQSEHLGRGNLGNYGKKVDLQCLQRNLCIRNTVAEFYHTIDGVRSDGFYTYLNQSMTIAQKRIFLFNDATARSASYGGADLVVLDYDTKQIIYKGITGTWAYTHHNNAQFFPARYKYDSSDKYPLLLLSRGDYSSTNVRFYIIRVQEEENNGEYSFSLTILKTIYVDHTSIPEASFNASMCIDGINNKLYMYSTRLDWRTTSNNWLIINTFELDSIGLDDLSGSVMLSANDLVARKDLNYFVFQGGCCYGGKLFLPLQNQSTINGGFTPVYNSYFVAMIDPATGTIESMIPSGTQENEGIAWYNGKMYLTTKNGSATAATTSPCFRLYEYVF
jgi:hypothetical protein